MPYLPVRHKVGEHTEGKLFFEKYGAARKANGSRGGDLLRNAAEPNEVVVLLEWDDLAKARQLPQSDDLQQEMQRAGVTDQPDVYFLMDPERTPE